jgi:hypothetical protein
MNLIKVFEQTNFQEKGSFYKILNYLIEHSISKEIDELLSSNSSADINKFENDNIVKLFTLLNEDYHQFLQTELGSNISQLDIFIDILIRDGNAIINSNWFEELYKKQLKKLKNDGEKFIEILDSESKDIDEQRRRDYNIYRDCVKVAYMNDANTEDKKVTKDEYSILKSLANNLELSNEEIRLIHYSIIPIAQMQKDSLIKLLKDLGIILYSKKTDNIYVPDEIVGILRYLRGKSIADKYYRRLLNLLKDPIINGICKKHNISLKLDRDQKIKQIITEGISVKTLLSYDIFRDVINVNDKKKEINTILIALGMESKGVTLDDKIQFIIDYFNNLENDKKLGITSDGYNSLCIDLYNILPELNNIIINEFEFQEDKQVLQSQLLIDHNIKPRDILDLISKENIKKFCIEKEIKTRGDLIENILESYTDSENIYIENYVNLGVRDLNVLKINNILLNAAEIGVKYEEVTKKLLKDLGFNVDEELRAKVNTAKDKVDILINLGNNEVIIVECKTSKSTQYNKFSSCSRQIKAYNNNLTHKGFRVVKSLLIAPDFTADFITECEMEMDINLSLIKSDVLYNIWNGFKKAQHKIFPYNLLMKDALISDEKILRALKVT